MAKTPKFLKRALPIVLVASTLFGCSGSDIDLTKITPEATGFTNTTTNSGLILMSQSKFDECVGWTVKDKENYEDVYSCTDSKSDEVHMAMGVYSLDMDKLVSSEYYKSGGADKSEVFVDTSKEAKDDVLVTYLDGQYLVDIPTVVDADFNQDLAEEDAEGVLATTDQVDSQNWVSSEDDEDVLISESSDAVMYMGAIFASMMLMKNSSFYKSGGADKSGIAVPSSYKSGSSSIAYQDGKYNNSSNSIKSSKVPVHGSSFKAPSNSAGKSVHGGVGSGARGGGAS